jgi:hypothetical protein
VKEVIAAFILMLALAAGYRVAAHELAASATSEPAEMPVAGPMKLKPLDKDLTFEGYDFDKKGPGILVPAR